MPATKHARASRARKTQNQIEQFQAEVKRTWDPETWAAKRKSNAESLHSLIEELDEQGRADLAVCARIIKANYGAETPFEEFFMWLIHCYGEEMWSALTPDAIVRDINENEFRQNFEDLQNHAPKFLERYPPNKAA